MTKDLALVAAQADRSGLNPFDGRDVVRSTIKITNAGDGLSEAMAVDPTEYHHGQEVTIVMRGVVSRVGFDPVGDVDDEEGALVRVHSIKAGTAVILDEAGEKKVAGALNRQADRIKRALEAAKGIDPLPGMSDTAEADGAEPGEDGGEGEPDNVTPITK